MSNPLPDKSLGQHWLNDAATLQTMVSLAHVGLPDTVLEIGPGLGSLTRALAREAGKVVALEFDARLCETLGHSGLPGNIELMHGDILTFDLTCLPSNYKVVANLPYYITSKIVRLLLESANPPSVATLLVQKEVAERIAAQPGDMSVLAVAVQWYAQPSLGPVVPAGLFTPPPQVDSRIITLIRRQKPLFDIAAADFFRIVKAGFGEKRKQLRNSLSGGLHLTKDETAKLLAAAQVPASARAEDLSLSEWYRVASIAANRR